MTSYPSDVEIGGVDNGKLREYLAISNKYSSREFLILSNASFISYHRKIEVNNELPKKDSTDLINNSHLSYARIAKVDSLVSLATNKKMASNNQHVDNKVSTLKRVSKLHDNSKGKQIKSSNSTSLKYISDNVYNMQILYDINQAVDLESVQFHFTL